MKETRGEVINVLGSNKQNAVGKTRRGKYKRLLALNERKLRLHLRPIALSSEQRESEFTNERTHETVIRRHPSFSYNRKQGDFRFFIFFYPLLMCFV